MEGDRPAFPELSGLSRPWWLTDFGEQLMGLDSVRRDSAAAGSALDSLAVSLEFLAGRGHGAPRWNEGPAWQTGERWSEPFDAIRASATRIADVTLADVRIALTDFARSSGVEEAVSDRDVEVFALKWARLDVGEIVRSITWWLGGFQGALADTAELTRLCDLTRRYLERVGEDREPPRGRPKELVYAIEASGGRAAIGFLRELAENSRVSERARADARKALEDIAGAITFRTL